MKSLLAVTVLVTVFSMNHANACSQQLPAFGQTNELTRVLASPVFQKELQKQVTKDNFVSISKISYENGVTFELSNNCTINVVGKYKAPTIPGMCAKFVKFIAKSNCI